MAAAGETLSAAETQRRHLKAGLFMVLANLLFIINDTGAKLLTETMNTGSVMTLRNSVASLAVLAFIAWSGELKRIGGIFGRVALLRTGVDTLLTVFFFVALAHMPIANLTAIVQSLPIVVAAGAVFTLKEKLGLARILTILGGFAGVLLIVQPGSDAFSAYSILGLMVVFCGAARDILTRHIGAHVPGSVIAFGNVLGVGIAGLFITPFQGGLDWPQGAQWAIGLMSGICVGGGLIVLIKTLRMAPIGVTAPFRYSVVLWSILSGWLVFGDVPNTLALAGIGLIVISGIAAMRNTA